MRIIVQKEKINEKILAICVKDGEIYTGGNSKLLVNRTKNKTIYKHEKTIRSIVASKRFLGSASYDCTAVIFENKEIFDVIEGPETEIKSMTFSENEEHLALCTRNGNVWICTVGSVIEVESIIEDHLEDVKGCKFYCGMLFTFGFDCTIRIYQYFDLNHAFEQVQCLGTESTIWDIVFNGDRMYASTENGDIIIYELQKGWCHIETKKISHLPIYCLEIFNDLVVSTVNIGNVVFLNRDLDVVDFIENLHDDFINCMYTDIAQNRIVVGSDDGYFSILNIEL